ncbi:MAG: metal-sulfur cluster assembly factor [Lactobacillaceae bacterium]|jgi:metal-sulfur cluster biosynthetic enzyme|nr:metal-sulfur cluster assembly factor [Lactobacillaceae bacterium]
MATQEELVWAALSDVEDPEIRCDVVNLGLIYDVEVAEETAKITMTWTMMGCPLSDLLEASIKEAAENVPGIETALINVVWEPAWTKDRLTPYAKMMLGVH